MFLNFFLIVNYNHQTLFRMGVFNYIIHTSNYYMNQTTLGAHGVPHHVQFRLIQF